jgi:hypothetical protein
VLAILFGEHRSREFFIRRTAEDSRHVLTSTAPVKGENGRVVAGMVVFMDVVSDRAEAGFGHGICPDRVKSLSPGLDLKDECDP